MSKRVHLSWILNGIARLFDWQGTMNTRHYIALRPRSDRQALANDWAKVGGYFNTPLGPPSRRLPYMSPETIAAGYAEMAADEEYEREALEWCESTVGETLD